MWIFSHFPFLKPFVEDIEEQMARGRSRKEGLDTALSLGNCTEGGWFGAVPSLRPVRLNAGVLGEGCPDRHSSDC